MRIHPLASAPFFPGFLAGALVACGGVTTGGGSAPGSGAGSGSVSGTVAGTTFTVASEIAFAGPESTDTVCSGSTDGGESCVTTKTGQGIEILLANRADFTLSTLQGIVSNTALPANLDLLALGVGNANGDVTTGTFNVVADTSNTTLGAHAVLITLSSSCASGLDINAIGGTLTLTQLTSARVTGTYDLTFGAEGTFSGAFDVPLGDGPDAGSPNTSGQNPGQPVCDP